MGHAGQSGNTTTDRAALLKIAAGLNSLPRGWDNDAPFAEGESIELNDSEEMPYMPKRDKFDSFELTELALTVSPSSKGTQVQATLTFKPYPPQLCSNKAIVPFTPNGFAPVRLVAMPQSPLL